MISLARVKGSQTVEIVVTTGCHCRCPMGTVGLDWLGGSTTRGVCRLRHATETTHRYRLSAHL